MGLLPSEMLSGHAPPRATVTRVPSPDTSRFEEVLNTSQVQRPVLSSNRLSDCKRGAPFSTYMGVGGKFWG